MKSINQYVVWFKGLNQDERQILGGVFVFVCGAIFLMYLVSTSTYHRKDAETRDMQTYSKPNYQLGKSYTKYMNHVYNSKLN